MSITFQPQFIRQDSSVPLRSMALGWMLGIIGVLAEAPVPSRFWVGVGITLLAGGLLAMTLSTTRSVRMMIGAAAGGAAAWFGYRFAVVDRLQPWIDDDTFGILERDHLSTLAIGFSIFVIGLGGMLEAVRAQSEPGRSPLPIRIVLLAIGAAIAAAACSLFEVSSGITMLVMLAVVLALGTLTWLRQERAPSDFQPTP
ncbi:MAG: hypothetical protein HKN94_05395 [Acidimicrobiales bacterium]|nr:hypothetical protein [Acidimicrobiia bacterium]NNC79569.1 hypothetical protein [Acidimicrobiales bacterium]RZV48621.1 MAG: hypothetical protein EX269_01225 [Acidimicrobiales bacterium]